MRSRRRVPMFVVLALAFAGCAIFAGKAEYADYRAVRTAPDDEARLLAERRYVAAHPHGTWTTAVQADRVAHELDVWNSSKTTREGLAYYLEAFPDAPHAAQARARLAALQSVQGHREDEAARRRAIEEERHRIREEARRTWATHSVAFWTNTLLGIGNWGAPIASVAGANPAFSRAFGEAPAPKCTRDECDKFYMNHFAIPVPGATRMERHLGIVLRLQMPGGNVDRAQLLMSGKGFSRWYEMENRTIVTDEDPQQRQQAIDWVLARIAPVLAEALPGATDVANPSLDVIVPLPFTADGQSTGIATPGSGATAEPDDDEDEDGAAASGAPDAGAAAPARDAGPAPAAGADGGAPAAEADGGTTAFDDLMRNAVPVGQDPHAPQVEPEAPIVAITPEDAGPLLPRVVRAISTPALRVIVFVANDEDYGTAYDGIVIERNRPQTARPPVRPVRPVRPPVRPRGPARPAHPPAPH